MYCRFDDANVLRVGASNQELEVNGYILLYQLQEDSYVA